MTPELKWMHCADLDLERDTPIDFYHFGLAVQMNIGPTGGESSDIFSMIYCSPSWLREEAKYLGVLIGGSYIISNEFDMKKLRAAVSEYLSKIEEPDWEAVAAKVRYIGHWEFEDYNRYLPEA